MSRWITQRTFAVNTVVRCKIPRKLCMYTEFNHSLTGKLGEWLYNTFEDQLETVLWFIGDLLTDFGTERAFMFY